MCKLTQLVFAKLPDDRVLEAFEVLKEVATWIESQGRRQRISKTKLEDYQQWQSEGANYIVLSGSETESKSDAKIAGLVTLRREPLSDWPELAELGPVWMLRGLATHPRFRHNGVGKLAVNESVRLVSENIYLDCVSQFLPEYYGSLGFEVIDQQTKAFDDNEPLDITLMKYSRI